MPARTERKKAPISTLIGTFGRVSHGSPHQPQRPTHAGNTAIWCASLPYLPARPCSASAKRLGECNMFEIQITHQFFPSFPGLTGESLLESFKVLSVSRPQRLLKANKHCIRCVQLFDLLETEPLIQPRRTASFVHA